MSQIKRNFLFNVVSLIVNIIIAFFYTPYLVKTLGILAYGILPLALIVNQYITILTTSLTGALTRFYSVKISEKKNHEASQALSSALFVIVGIIFFGIIFSLLIIFNLEKIFTIPVNLINSGKKLFLFTFIGFFLSLISNFFNIVLYAKNRLDLLKKLEVLRILSRTIFNVSLFEFFFVDVMFVGLAGFLGELLVLFYSIFLFTKHNNEGISIRFTNTNKRILISILTMTIWVVVHQLGDLAIYKTDVLFVNKFWGVKESGILGAISDFCSYVMVLVGVISSLFGPLILIAYSNKEHEEVKKMVLNNSMYVGVFSSFIVALLIGFSSEFLTLWIGKDFAAYFNWFQFKLFAIPFYAASGVFAFVYRSWNLVKLPAISTVCLGLITVLVTFFLSKSNNNSKKYIDYILISNAFLCFIQTFLLGAYMIKSIYNEIKWKTLLDILFKILGTMFFVVFLSKMMTNFFLIDNWLNFIFFGGITAFISLCVIYFAFFNKIQRVNLLNLFAKN